jgi:DNA-binding transcriptional regulator YdaS (Cro superfamily)
MSKKLAIFAACLVAGATPAFAQNATCIEPAPPTVVNGATAAQPELVAAIAQVKDFIAKSDIYQACIASDLEAKKKASEASGATFDNQLQQVALAKVAANQTVKDKVARDINVQITAFKAKAK